MMSIIERTNMTLSCRDCEAIPKVADAGKIFAIEGDDCQVMHNGLRVVAGGYHGDWMAQIIRGLRGHHEPQEEAAFHALLRYVRHGSLMAELGAFWAYYSLWFLTEVPGSEVLCVEPDPNNMAVGSRNAALNGLSDRASFHQAAIGDRRAASVDIPCESDGTLRSMPMLDMAGLLDRAGGRPIEILHIDAQGAEADFVRSMRDAVAAQRVRFLVVSTHHAAITGRGDTHPICLDALKQMGGRALVEHSVEESFSGDGLIVWSFLKDDESIELPPLSRNRAASSLFGVI
ncbi:FkbM family methyltransferase [Aurantimonas endophytica]|uniref:FkbM family methyltransferase n=1 Tax=Aurantimonas endophytica TaxID=1522175 RepID=A0A7W6HD83_9HYPH|nr:FkbM family methyltransferase [Aurantimonas endophytica]MBB4003074.1 FkbM family methyltransferase [Aurantimonas endophytica]MCO6403945.1 FkbM family methyltransferase [Aurantimonas endophytica]